MNEKIIVNKIADSKCLLGGNLFYVEQPSSDRTSSNFNQLSTRQPEKYLSRPAYFYRTGISDHCPAPIWVNQRSSRFKMGPAKTFDDYRYSFRSRFFKHPWLGRRIDLADKGERDRYYAVISVLTVLVGTVLMGLAETLWR